MEEHTVLIGASGWVHDEWNDEFYPDDLPEEWRLGFYGNEFSVVLVPAAYWDQGASVVQEWLEETDESPRFICEWPVAVKDDVAAKNLLDVISILGDRVLGILLPVYEQPDVLTRELCKKIAERFALCLDIQSTGRDAIASAFRAELADDEISICWHGDEQHVDDLASGKLIVARISDKDLSPRALRFLVEQCIKQSRAERSVALIFDGTPPQMQQMVDAGVILDLL